MKQGKRMWMVVLGAAAVVLVIVAVPWRRGTETAAVPAPVEPVRGDSDLPSDRVTPEQMAEQRERSASLAWGRNPFQGPAASTTGNPTPTHGPRQPWRPRLTGVSFYDQDRRAIIGREVVKEGDRLASGHLVQEITTAAVTLLMDEEEVIVRLGDQR